MHLNSRTALFTVPTLYQVQICERILLYSFDSFHSLVKPGPGYFRCTPIGYHWPESIVYGPRLTCGCSSCTPSSASTLSAFAALMSNFSASLASTAPSTLRVTCYSIGVPFICLLAPCAEAQAWNASSLVPRLSASPRYIRLVRPSCLSHRNYCQAPACETTITDSEADK